MATRSGWRCRHPRVYRLFRALAPRVPGVPLAVHLHNTRGSGAANVMAAHHAGVTIADASIGGLGGCPFAPRPPGTSAEIPCTCSRASAWRPGSTWTG
ncbi:MAG: hypothetical protein U0470_03480 [Anaerolineae bacterium]